MSLESFIAFYLSWNLSVPYPFLSPRIRARERLSRDETAQRPPDWSPDMNQGNRHRTQRNTAQYTPQHAESIQQRTVHQPQPSPGHHPSHGQTAYPSTPPEYRHSGPAVDSQPYLGMPAPVATAKLPGPPEVPPRRRVSADQIHAAHKEARLEARQALKEEAHTEGLLKSRKAVLPSEIRRREKSVDDPQRGRHEDMDWQNYSPEQRRMSQGEEDWDWDKTRERGRERNVERMRERGRQNVDSQEERIFKSLQPSHSPVRQQPRQHQSSETIFHQEPQIPYQEPPMQQQYEPSKRQHVAQIPQPDPQRQHQYDQSRLPQEPQRQQPFQIRQEYKLQQQEPPSQQQDLEKRTDPQLDKEFEPQREQQQDPSEQQRFDSAVYHQKGSSLPQVKSRMELGVGPKPKTRTRSMSDIGITEHSAMYRMERAAASRDASRAIPSAGVANGDLGTLDTRVSVAQLRHSYLENANRKPELYVQ